MGHEHLEEEHVEVVLQRDVDHCLDGIDAAPPRLVRDGGIGEIRRLQDGHRLELRASRFGPERRAVVAVIRGVDEPPAHLGIAQEQLLLGVGLAAHLLPLGQAVNMVEMGVLDPTKVTRAALQNAASIAGLILTTDAMVAETPKEDAGHAGHGHGGGMGGMGGMDM